MADLIETLIQWDRSLFQALNGASNDLMDFIMWWASDRFIWIPVYALLLYLLWRQYRGRIWLVVFFAALLIFLSDQISVHLFKDVVQRLRPCHEPALEGMVHIVNNKCGGLYGFYSSHASNIFAVAVFFLSLYRGKKLWMTGAVVLWALFICYSRIYLGVHYPGDVVAGGLAGSLLGWMLARFLKNLVKRQTVSSHPVDGEQKPR